MIKRLSGQFNIIGKAAISSMAPALERLLFVLIGILIGMAIVYKVVPIKFRDAEPVHLAGGYKDQWIKMTAVELKESGDTEEAKRKVIDAGVTPDMIQELMNANRDTDPTLYTQLEGLLAVAQANENAAKDQAKEIESGFLGGIFWPLACFVGTAIILLLMAAFFTLYWAPVSLFTRRRPATRAVPGAPVSGAMAHAEKVAAQRAAEKTDFAAVGEVAPVAQYMSTYIAGDELYDDSFSIETPSGDFLGECGSGISETIGVGDPKKVTATEVWLFDKNDIRTVTKVLMSEHAYNDQALRTKLAPKGEAVLVTPGGVTILETQTLRVQVRIVDLQYGEGALPQNSFFQRLTVEIAAWPKEVVGGGSGLPQPPDTSAAFGDTAELLNY